MSKDALKASNVAVITGGASGIGLAAAVRFAKLGMKVCIADLGTDRLADAEKTIAKSDGEIMSAECDVSRLDDLVTLEKAVRNRFGKVDVLMNNAGIQPGTKLFGPQASWERTIAVNMWGVINGARVFAPGMIAQGTPGLIIDTGSKQGITTPPGDPAYNISKAAVKVFTEALQHELRNTQGCKITAHLLIPGFVFTGLTSGGRTEKPAGAWTPDETITFMLDRILRGDFYILCPDNEVSRPLDEKRIEWAARDLIENRPPLSRWHKEYAEAFAAFSEAKSG
jgi:NAD(P)-dependent dehydrogenase (short-subunit alcohol dehydrogenase family)